MKTAVRNRWHDNTHARTHFLFCEYGCENDDRCLENTVLISHPLGAGPTHGGTLHSTSHCGRRRVVSHAVTFATTCSASSTATLLETVERGTLDIICPFSTFCSCWHLLLWREDVCLFGWCGVTHRRHSLEETCHVRACYFVSICVFAFPVPGPWSPRRGRRRRMTKRTKTRMCHVCTSD